MTELIAGYAWVSSEIQDVARQVRELEAAGCTRIWSETASGRRGSARPEWESLHSHLREGDELVVTELSRLGRSTADLSRLLAHVRPDQDARQLASRFDDRRCRALRGRDCPALGGDGPGDAALGVGSPIGPGRKAGRQDKQVIVEVETWDEARDLPPATKA